MKKINLLLVGIAMVAGMTLASCSGKSSDTQETTATETAEATESKNHVTVLTNDVLETGDADQLVIVDFNATWCGPCQRFAPIFHDAAEKYAGKIKFISVDVDACPEVAKKYGVSSIPQITYIKPDGTVDSHVGLMSAEEFEEAIKAHM